MKLTINNKAYTTRGITGFVGGILMLPAAALMIGAKRAPHLDKA